MYRGWDYNISTVAVGNLMENATTSFGLKFLSFQPLEIQNHHQHCFQPTFTFLCLHDHSKRNVGPDFSYLR